MNLSEMLMHFAASSDTMHSLLTLLKEAVSNPPGDLASATGTIASNGILGSLLVILGVAYWRKDRTLETQSVQHRDQIILIQREVILAVTKIADLVDFIEKREHERDLQRAREETPRRGGAR